MIKHKVKQMTVFVKKSIALKEFYPTVLLQYILIPHTVAIIAFYFPAPMPICSPDTVEAYNIFFFIAKRYAGITSNFNNRINLTH